MIRTSSFLTSVILLTLLSACGSSPNKVSGGEETEGWRREGNSDVFYMKIVGRASEKAIERNDYAMKKSTCVEATHLQAADRIVRKIYGETLKAQSLTEDGAVSQSVISSVRGGLIKGTSVKECAPLTAPNDWTNCECVHYVGGPNLKAEFEKISREASDLNNR
jgi:hypothetical protein